MQGRGPWGRSAAAVMVVDMSIRHLLRLGAPAAGVLAGVACLIAGLASGIGYGLIVASLALLTRAVDGSAPRDVPPRVCDTRRVGLRPRPRDDDHELATAV